METSFPPEEVGEKDGYLERSEHHLLPSQSQSDHCYCYLIFKNTGVQKMTPDILEYLNFYV